MPLHHSSSRNSVTRLVQAVALGAGAGCVWLVLRRFGRSQAPAGTVQDHQQGDVSLRPFETSSLLVDLPDDVFQAILEYLSRRDHTVLCLTCVKLRQLLQRKRQSLSVPQLSGLSSSHASQLPVRFPHVKQLHLNNAPTGGILESVLDVVLPTRRWRAAIPHLAMVLISTFLVQRLLQQLKQRNGVARVLLMLWLLGPPVTGIGIGLADVLMHSVWSLTLGNMEARAQMQLDEGGRPGWLIRWLLGSRLSVAHPLHARTCALFQRLPEIQHLQLGEGLVRTSIIKAAVDLAQLRALSLISSPSVSSPSLEAITLLTRLTSFSLVCTSYDNFRMTHYLHHSDETIRHLIQLPALAAFAMTPCMGVTDAGLGLLTGMTKLTSLHLHVCLEVSDDGLSALSALTQLKALSLTWPLYTTPAGISHLASTLTGVTSLDFSGNQWGLTDESLESIAQHMTRLRVLNVYMCYGIAGGMALAGPMLSQLQSLTVPWSPGGYVQVWAGTCWATCLHSLCCVADSDSCLVHLHRLSGLTSLRLVLHSRVSDIASASLSRLSRLTSLSVDFNERGSISTPGWYAVLRGLWGTLRQLIVQRDGQLDAVSMRALRILLMTMRSITLEQCEHVSAGGVGEWLAHLPRLECLGLWQCPSMSKLKLARLQQQYSYISIESELLANVHFVNNSSWHLGPEAINQG